MAKSLIYPPIESKINITRYYLFIDLFLNYISNKYVDLAPVPAALAEENGFAGRICEDDEDDEDIEKSSSTWVILAKKEADFGALAANNSWKKLDRRPSVRPWTDDFSNILAVFQW